MVDEQTLIAEVVRLRECEEYPFAFWQVAAILNARYPGLAPTAEQTRVLYLMQHFENDPPATLNTVNPK